MKISKNSKTVALVTGTIMVLTLLGTFHTDYIDSDRTTEIKFKSKSVMPFDLENSQHYFYPTTKGGTMLIETTNQEEIKLVREHMKTISNEFKLGNYARPTSIHGDSMPGIKTLESDYKKIKVSYKERMYGGEIHFLAKSKKDIEAIHQWFTAQVNDHSDDATLASSKSEHTNMDDIISSQSMWEYHHRGEPIPERLKNK